MWNLLRKDFLLHKKMLFIMLMILLVVIIILGSGIWEGIIFSIAIIMHIYSADERPSAQYLLNSLPFTRKEIVSSKYIGSLILLGAVLLTLLLGNWIFRQEIFPLDQLLFIACLVIVFISFAFPYSYIFSSQSLLLGSGVLFVLYLIAVNLFLPNINDLIREVTLWILTLADFQLYLIAILAVLTLYTCSWVFSVRIYCKKVF